MNSPTASAVRFDVEAVRAAFPILAAHVRGKPLIYLDNAASAQKPRAVIEAIRRFYEAENANVHRGVHYLSQLATDRHEAARTSLQRFLNAREDREIIFTAGATDGINLVATSFGQAFLKPGDEVLLTQMEHHSNIVPWQMLRERAGIVLKVIPVTDTGELELAALDQLLTERTKLVAMIHVSNTLGTVNPVREIIAKAHAKGAAVLLDCAQAAPHLRIDVQEIGCDFAAIAGHKMFGPTGVGVLYGRAEWLDRMPPHRGGGNMIRSVSFEKTTYATVPARFEAGTPPIADAIGLGTAAEYLMNMDFRAAMAHEADLLIYATGQLRTVPGLRIIGTAAEKVPVISFTMDSAHPHDIGQILDDEGIAIRAGHHCTQPLVQRFGVPATARASFAFYNTRGDADRLVAALHKVNEVFG
jgi:cysteine desulfurase/selenocysteine lyase